MTLRKWQLVVLMLAASAAGAGVGWLARFVPADEHPSAQSQTSAMMGGLKEELAALRQEVRELKPRTNAQRKLPEAAPGKHESVTYQGHPTSYWLAALRDRDADFRLKAIAPLASIAKVDRTVIPVLLDGAGDDSPAVREAIAYALPPLAPAPQEAVPALLRSEMEARNLLPLVKEIDPTGKVSLAAALDALKDKRRGVRRAAAFVVCDLDKSKADRTVDVLVEVLNDVEKCQRNDFYKTLDYLDRAEDAARILGAIGSKARRAAPALVKAIRLLATTIPIISQGDAKRLQPFISALQHVDVEGTAVPLLGQMLNDEEWLAHYAAALTLHQLGAKSQKALPALIACIGNERRSWSQVEAIQTVSILGPAAKPAVPALLAIVRKGKSTEEPQSSLYGAAVAALLKIDPQAINSKEPPLAPSRKPAKKSKTSEQENR